MTPASRPARTVFWEAAGELYRLENTTEETPDRDGLAAWLEKEGRGEAGYPDVLELIAPDPGHPA